MALSKDEILDAIAEMSVMDIVELVEAMEEKFGVSAAAAVAVAAPAAGGATDAGGSSLQAQHAPPMQRRAPAAPRAAARANERRSALAVAGDGGRIPRGEDGRTGDAGPFAWYDRCASRSPPACRPTVAP